MRHMLLNARQAAEQLRQGKVIAYPTEAVFGLGCDPSNERAVRSLLSLKHRPESAGLILIGANFTQFEGWVADLADEVIEPALETWPGPVTWLFPSGPKTSDFISGSRDTVAIRVTGHQASAELCTAFDGPLVSTSANPRSAPPARSSGEVEDYFGAYIGGILEGVLGGNERPSEIRDLVTGTVIRPAG